MKVLDFGLAKASQEKQPRRQSVQLANAEHGGNECRVILGTAAYMSPEQAKGQRVDRTHGYLGVRLRAVRDADGPSGV